MQEYSEQEKQQYVEWVKRCGELHVEFFERIEKTEDPSEKEHLLLELEDATGPYCPHGKSVMSNCVTCKELNRLCFPRFCFCGKPATGCISYCGAKETEFLCDEHGRDRENFEPFEEE